MATLGNIQIDKEKCSACGICVDTCILDNLILMVSPCRQACPLNLNCQGYVHHIALGNFEEALKEIYQKLPFVGIIGRICSQECEMNCRRKEKDGQAVAIRKLKRFLADKVFTPELDISIAEDKGKRVAIVGSGPTGMMAAFDLRKKGYGVTIFEALPKFGGMLSSVIPESRLPLEILEREFHILLDMGVEVKLSTPVGQKVGLGELCRDFDAVFLATGVHVGLRLNIPGEDAKGVWQALDFLKRCRGKVPIHLGDEVVVIGGGNTAVNAAQTAKRLGSKLVRIVCLETLADMPAFPWEIEDALEEGIFLHNSWGPAEMFIQDGGVVEVKFRRCTQVFDNDGQFFPCFDDEETRVFPVTTVIVAVGQVPELSYFQGEVGLADGHVKVNPVTLQTDNHKVFAGGDMVPGKKSVVDAMACGRKAALSIDRFLQDEGLEWGRQDFDNSHELEFEVDFSLGSEDERVVDKKLPMKERGSFKEMEIGLTTEEAVREAKRCIKCGGPYARNDTCWFCLPCEVECPYEALTVEIPYLTR